MNNKKDKRPPVAIGHINLITKDVPSTSLFMQSLGLRKVFQKKTFECDSLKSGTRTLALVRCFAYNKGIRGGGYHRRRKSSTLPLPSFFF